MNATDTGYATGQLPLAGAVLCCTAIAPEQRAQLAAIGAQMGATIKLDLTSDVTHLIVGNTDSAKYRYVAKSRDDVKVLSPAWLEALRHVWMQGHDNVDVAALETEYRLPTLFGLKICLTGFDNPEQRKYIQETVDMNGAEYHGDLTKSVTHLIAATPSGKKYEHALNWSMKIVSLEWFEQSIERGMVLDESFFNPTLPIEARGKGARDRTSATPLTGKRTRNADQSQALNPFRRKLRRSASTKFGSQSDALWAGITAANLERQQDDGDDWTELNIAQHDDSSAPTPASPAVGAPTPEEKTDFANPAANAPVSPSYVLAQGRSGHGLFEGRVVCPYGFDDEKTDILRQHLHSHGARVLTASQLNNAPSDDIKRGFLIVPHDAEVDYALIPERAGSLINIVSNWWVERCLHGKRLVDPADDVLSRPFGKLSVGGFSGLTINSTGFAGIELLHVTKVVALLGATYDEHLSAKTSVIVCNSSGSNLQKLKFAAEKRIPAVTSAWLSNCICNCRLQSYDDYRFDTNVATPQVQNVKSRPRALRDAPVGAGIEDSGIRPRQHKPPPVKIVSKPQGIRRPRTLELAPSTDATPADDSNNSTLGQDDSIGPNFDGQASLPLQDISANSPRRPSTSSISLKSASRARSSSAESLIRAAPPARARTSKDFPRKPTPDSVIPADSLDNPSLPVPPQPQILPKELPAADKDYSDILAQLRANRKSVPSPADAGDGSRRRRRQLGRATSTRSNQSAASSGNANVEISLDGAEDEDSVLVEEYQPSQQLGWEEPGAAKAREVMIRKLGGTIKEKSVTVQGIGMVMDEGVESGGRSVRKRRG
ncbi:hypothetical protein T440DRAFT_448770 [Plenodomus tracheiphilus IPT5]|uniref:BRCT domain-containing protein n=1 Tax=Plenodomus tracheiphilus IPT5 TaxID=1408161 RepID=A0A6A7B867_9PLEO|nr:hypothetical protein T440DRAFT_448770 [Plenodomus tracheiphilus IPT5]